MIYDREDPDWSLQFYIENERNSSELFIEIVFDFRDEKWLYSREYILLVVHIDGRYGRDAYPDVYDIPLSKKCPETLKSPLMFEGAKVRVVAFTLSFTLYSILLSILAQ